MDNAAGTLDKFHLGVSADGQSCVMVFIDEARRSINCVADYAEFQAFIANLTRVADEMARRRGSVDDTALPEEPEEPAARAMDLDGTGTLLQETDSIVRLDALNVASAAFQMNTDAGYIEGALVGESGEIVGIRMCPEVACQLTRAMLMSAPAASSC